MRSNATTPKQITIQVRVRPARIGVLLPWEAEPEQALKAIHMLTVVWGGRYAPIIPCGGTSEQIAYAKQWLTDVSPDFVCGIGVDHGFWRDLAYECCRPLRYYEVGENPESVLYGVGFLPEPVSADPGITHMLARNPGMEKSRFFHLETGGTFPLDVAVAAVFGYLPDGRTKGALERLKGEYTAADLLSPAASFLDAFTREKRLTLLDAGSHLLGSQVFRGDAFALPPTVVLLANCGADLALFWALRMQQDPCALDRILPLPAGTALTDPVVDAVVAWLSGFQGKANYCRIVCFPSRNDCAQALARRLRPRVVKVGVSHVDILAEQPPPPIVVGSERTQTIPATRNRNSYTFAAPAPGFADCLSTRYHWMVDLLKDEDTGRAPGENIPPSFHVTAHEVLNSPAPPSAGQSAIDPLRYSVDVVSLRAKKEKGLAKCHLPTGLELIGEHIRECGLRPVDDDKRPLYEAVVGLFGSLYEAAQSCREPFRTMLLAMKDRELLESQIREKARLGKTKRTPAEAPFIRNWYKKDPIRARLGEERFREHASICHPPADSPLNALDYWRDKGVVGQVFLTPKCPACRRQTWVGSIDLSAPVICRDCGRPIPIGGSVEVGYRLEPIVGAALDDGLVPVALTGEFLRNLTHQGFQWVPGFRFAKAGKEQDIDIVALCDGHLVMAECKELGSTKPSVKTWSKVGKQFEGLIETARDCSAEAVFLASLAWSYPPGIRELVKSANDEKMSVHLLTRADLDKGHRKGMRRIGGERKEVWLHIHDFLPAQPRPRRKRRGKREVRL